MAKEKYIDFCMSQIEFWESKVVELMSQTNQPNQDAIITEIDSVLRTRSTAKLHELYGHLKELKENDTITEDDHRGYLKYISTSKIA